ncbi:MAG TPA: RDD family protein [Chloroflexota bacterium]|nr:RDD family protein [Chloroflexota bacterium]
MSNPLAESPPVPVEPAQTAPADPPVMSLATSATTRVDMAQAPRTSDLSEPNPDAASHPVGSTADVPPLRMDATPVQVPPDAKSTGEPALRTVDDTYAGFWRRALAAVIDLGLVNIASFVLIWLLGALLGMAPVAQYLLRSLLWHPMAWLYFAIMESSGNQATIGKMALGLRVSRADSTRLSFGRATARFAGKYISAIIIGIGFIMAAFTERKQALHDMMAGTVVLKPVR